MGSENACAEAHLSTAPVKSHDDIEDPETHEDNGDGDQPTGQHVQLVSQPLQTLIQQYARARCGILCISHDPYSS